MAIRRWMGFLTIGILIASLLGAKPRYEELKKEIPFEKLTELRVKLEIGVAELKIGKTEGDNLFEADIRYRVKRGEPKIRFRKSGDVGYLTIESGDKDVEFGRGDEKKGDENWILRFSPKVKTEFSMDLGLVDGELDLTDLKVTDLSLSGGLSDIDLRFDKPNPEVIDDFTLEIGMGEFRGTKLGNANFRNLDLESGMGSADLDLSGNWRQPEAEMTLEVGMGSAEVRIPEGIGVEVYNEDSFLSSVKLDRELREVDEGLHRTENWEEADHRISIDAEVGLGSVRIKIVD